MNLPNSIKLIFLNAEPILASERSRIAYGHVPGTETELNKFVDPVAVLLLNTLIKKSGAMLVISSKTRFSCLLRGGDGKNYFDVARLQSQAEVFGIQGQVISGTPYLEEQSQGAEIKLWLQQFAESNPETKIESFIVLDTDGRERDGFKEHYILLNPTNGIQYEDFIAACKVLGVENA